MFFLSIDVSVFFTRYSLRHLPLKFFISSIKLLLLYKVYGDWNTFVHGWVVFPKFKQLFVRGNAKNDLFGTRELSFIVVALRISFKLLERISLSGFCTDIRHLRRRYCRSSCDVMIFQN